MFLKELTSVLSDMQKIIDLSGSKEMIFDRDCLNCLKQASMASQATTKDQLVKSFQESNSKF